MTKTEKLIVSIITVALGILLIVLRGATVQVVTSIFGVLLIVLGCLDIMAKDTLIGAAKFFFGIFILAFGWLVLSVVLYAVSVTVLVIALWWVYELWRTRCIRSFSWMFLFQYAQPILLAAVGVLLLFHQIESNEWLFVTAGVFTVLEGAFLFASAMKTIE